MKKILLIFSLIVILLLCCSCKKINHTDNTEYTSSVLDEISSDGSSVSSEMILPERDLPNESSNTLSNETTQVLSEEETTSEVVILSDHLNIDVYRPHYLNTNFNISFTLYSDIKSSFTYFTDFFLQIYEDGEWKYHTTKNGEIEYTFNTKKSESHIEFVVFDLQNKYHSPLPNGTYRIIQESDYGTIISNSFQVVDSNFYENEY